MTTTKAAAVAQKTYHCLLFLDSKCEVKHNLRNTACVRKGPLKRLGHSLPRLVKRHRQNHCRRRLADDPFVSIRHVPVTLALIVFWRNPTTMIGKY